MTIIVIQNVDHRLFDVNVRVLHAFHDGKHPNGHSVLHHVAPVRSYFDLWKIIKSCLVGTLVKAAPKPSNTQDALLAGLDDMGSVEGLREVVAASIAGKSPDIA